MNVFPVSAATVEGYVTKREPFRKAHIERLVKLRSEGVVRMGGPWPDGRGVDLVYRCRDAAQLKSLGEDDPYWKGGVWSSYASLPFSVFVEPTSEVPVVLDGSRKLFIVEGPAGDALGVEPALEKLRDQGRMWLGGVVEQRLWALTTSDDETKAIRSLVEATSIDMGRLAARPLIYVL